MFSGHPEQYKPDMNSSGKDIHGQRLGKKQHQRLCLGSLLASNCEGREAPAQEGCGLQGKMCVRTGAKSRPTLRPHGLQPTRLLCPWDFPGKSTGVGCHCLLHMIVQLSHPYMTTRKTIALTRQTFFGKVMSLLFNMLSRLVITFLGRGWEDLGEWH